MKESSSLTLVLGTVGSDLDHRIKAAAAQGEPQWDGIGEAAGLRVWRIEQFRVVPWPEDQYGSFHTGDSYVVLHSYTKGDDNPKLYHDLHIWIGSASSQDEYGTAAYKMTEADEYLGGSALQHREIQGHESAMFRSYFTELQYLEGGVDSGFTHVEAPVAVSRLYRVKGTFSSGLSLTTMPAIAAEHLNQNDAFILYINNRTVFVWHGTDANPQERNQANTWAETLCTNGTVVTIEAGEETEAFWSHFPDGAGDIAATADGLEDADVVPFQPALFQLTPDGAKPVASVTRSALDSSDVFLLDAGWALYVWMGAQADRTERLGAMAWAQAYCQKDSPDVLRTEHLPLQLLKDGYETEKFWSYFSE
jgi:gelsolin